MRPLLLVAIAFALLAPATRAAASPRLHGIPTHVRAGSELHIRWTGLGPGAHEAELELSLAGGRWMRISPEQDAREGGFTWHVPAGLAGPARLRIRYGGQGFEAEGDAPTQIVIEPDAAATRAPDPTLGEWWHLGESPSGLPGPNVASAPSLQARGPSLALSPETDRIARHAATFAGRTAACAPASSRCDAIPRRAGVSRSYPLRI
jgi:hypothetical protein